MGEVQTAQSKPARSHLGVTCLGVRVSSWLYLLTSIVAMAVCFSGLMMLLSVLGRTEQAAGGSAMAIMLVMATQGRRLGSAHRHARLDADHEPHQPRQMGILALEGAICEASISTQMLLPCGILLSVGVLSFGLGPRILSRRTF